MAIAPLLHVGKRTIAHRAGPPLNPPAGSAHAPELQFPCPPLREQRSLLLFLFLMLGFRSAWADWMQVPSGSMNPTILEGDRILVNKHAYALRIPLTLVRLTARPI